MQERLFSRLKQTLGYNARYDVHCCYVSNIVGAERSLQVAAGAQRTTYQDSQTTV